VTSDFDALLKFG